MKFFWSKPENRKWQGRKQLYKGRFYYLKQSFKVICLILFLVGAGFGYMKFKNSEALAIKHIEVLGDLKFTKANQHL